MTEPSMSPGSLPHLLQIASAASPVGSFAWSEGLECAVALGDVEDEDTARDWIGGLLTHTVLGLDVPLLARMHAHHRAGRVEAALAESDWLLACRETSELRDGDRQQGRALLRVLEALEVTGIGEIVPSSRVGYACAFSLACVHARVAVLPATVAYVCAWLENAVLAAVKLVPLGQMAGQRLQWQLGAELESRCSEALSQPPAAIAGGAPGQAIVSAMHELQATRLYRS